MLDLAILGAKVVTPEAIRLAEDRARHFLRALRSSK